jgi:hypothetical protein
MPRSLDYASILWSTCEDLYACLLSVRRAAIKRTKLNDDNAGAGMDASTLLNILALAVSFISLTASGLLAMRQTLMLRRANELPIFVDLTRDFRSPEFQQAQDYVLNELDSQHLPGPGDGISNLPLDARKAVSTVISFYITLGAYVAFGLADEKIVIQLFGYRAGQSWNALEPLILREREIRQGGAYASLFEDLVCRNRRYHGKTVIRTFRLATQRKEDNPIFSPQPKKAKDAQPGLTTVPDHNEVGQGPT